MLNWTTKYKKSEKFFMAKISFWRACVLRAVWLSCVLCVPNFAAETTSAKNSQNLPANDINSFGAGFGTDTQILPANTTPAQSPTKSPQSPAPPQTPPAQDDESKIFFVEFGIGYTRVNYTATQRALGNIYVKEGITTDIYEGQTYPKKGVGNGVELALTLNWWVTQRFGVNIGGGGEFVAVKWQSPLLDYNYYENDASESVAEMHFFIDSVSKDTLMSGYFTLGAFYELWRGKEKAVRIFGNTGWGVSKFAKSSFETDWHTKHPAYREEAKGRITLHFYTLGVRYIFAKRHGIEFSSRLKGKFAMDNKTQIKTNISWKPTLNLRYVWEF